MPDPGIGGAIGLIITMVFIFGVDRVHARVRQRKQKLARPKAAPTTFRTWEVTEVDRMWTR